GVIKGKAGDCLTGMVLVDLAGRPFGRAVLELPVATSTGAVTGVVRNRNGLGVPRATVVAIGTDMRTQSDEFGRFTLPDVVAGPRIVEARAIGYAPARPQTTIRPGSAERVERTLDACIPLLEPVPVEGRYEPS